MISTVIMTLIGLIVLTVNSATMFLTFPAKRSLRFSVGAIILFTVAFQVFTSITGKMGVELSGLRGVIYLPLMVLLLRASLFKKVFAFFFQYILTVFQSSLAAAIIRLFVPAESDVYYIVLLITLSIIFGGYIALMYTFGRRIFDRLFVDGNPNDWALYAFGAIFSYAALTLLRIFPVVGWMYILLLVFIFWSFAVLCFAIVNTHEKSKQRYEAEFAREVISSGREHYQKMEELHDRLRTLRHDYKYHLIAIDELLESDNKEKLRQYLNGIQAQLSESEMQNFCSNSVINVLLVRYAERCAKLGIAFTADIVLPETISVPNYDLCIVIGNLLENAVEACQKQSGVKNIEIILKPLGEQLALRVKNSFDGQVFENNGRFISLKKDGGFGLRSIDAVAARYDGELLLHWEGNIFSAYVTLRL